MKKIFVHAALAAFASVLLASCGSTKIAIQEHSPVALMSITGNSMIPWATDDSNNSENEDADGLLSTMVNKLIDGGNPEILTAVDRLDYAGESFAQILPEMTGCEVLSKEAVVNSEAYIYLGEGMLNFLSATKTATNYHDLSTLGAKKTSVALKELNAKSAVMLTFNFQKEIVKGNKGNGEICGIVSMKARMLNSRGKEIINKTYTVQTPKHTKIANHKYDKNAFVATFNEGIDAALRQFALEFVGADDDTNAEALLEQGVQAQAIALPVRPKKSAETVETESAKTEETAQ